VPYVYRSHNVEPGVNGKIDGNNIQFGMFRRNVVTTTPEGSTRDSGHLMALGVTVKYEYGCSVSFLPSSCSYNEVLSLTPPE
jgi:hypothetical protein